jgi:XTP/dITP diphosphohydrolase
MTSLLIATRNTHKTREFAEILGPAFAVRDLTAIDDVPAVEETGATFAENATIKAVAASVMMSEIVVADDSGLEVEALNGAPGVYSARYAGENATDAANVAKLLEELRRAGATTRGQRAARFCCTIALARCGKVLELFTATAEGHISDQPAGDGGFGYDPVFVPDGCERTFSEVGAEVKNRISHRAKAIARLRDYFASRAMNRAIS